MLVGDMIAAAAARDPERVAIACGDERLTYRELRLRVQSLARHLVRLGVRREQLVAIAVEPSPWAPIAMLAVHAAGGAYVPLDPSYPAAQLSDMLAQIGPAIVLTTSRVELPVHAGPRIDLDRGWRATSRRALPGPAPSSLAYVIFTSGTTGRPKGVMIEQRGLANLVAAQIEMFAIARDSVVLQFAPLSFDASVSEVFTALAAGATLCLAPRDELAPGPRLAATVRRHGVTVATLPPSSLALIEPEELAGVRTLVSAGEACSASLVARWAPGRRFVNAYGPTEATVCATAAVCDREPVLGAPLAGCTIAVLDENLAEVAAGEVGEIYIGGAGVARGYLGRADLTAERFVPDPASPGARRYRTGDLARRRSDGTLEFVGRADEQVKLRGYRIELGGVAAVLRAQPGVRDALAIAQGDRLVAYVIADPELDRVRLRLALARELPAFAQPSDIVVLVDWPRTPAGKIDRARLPAPVRTGSRSVARSELELALAAIWQDVLGVTEIGPEDDFFALGGHSLLAIRMLARVSAELSIDLPLSVLAERRTLAALAETLGSRGARVSVHSPLLVRAGRGRPLVLAPPVSGSALAYLPLVQHMTADRAVHAFHALAGTTVETFEDLAARFVEELLVTQPRGPYLLGGWSIGGALAFEMALQLQAAGNDVPALILFDTNAPTPYLARGIKERFGTLDASTLAFMYANNFARCFGIDLGITRSQFAAIAGEGLESAVLRELRRVPAFAPDIDLARLRMHLAAFSGIARGFSRWRPAKRYTGRVVLFLAGDGHPEFGAERYDWSAFVTQPIETIQVPGNHFSLVNEPHVATLAAELDRVLEGIV